MVLRAPAAAPGSGPASTTFAMGARVRLDFSEELQAREDGERFTSVEIDALFGPVRARIRELRQRSPEAAAGKH